MTTEIKVLHICQKILTTMTKSISLVLFALMLLFACKKTTSTPAPTPEPSTLSLLAGKQWIYDEIYHNFDGTSGILIYKRGSAANAENWDAARVIYWSTGLSDEWGPTGNYIQGTWQLNSDSTLMHYTNNVGVNGYSKVMQLDNSHYVWYDTVNLVEGKMILK